MAGSTYDHAGAVQFKETADMATTLETQTEKVANSSSSCDTVEHMLLLSIVIITVPQPNSCCETTSRLKENREYHPKALLSINVFYH